MLLSKTRLVRVKNRIKANDIHRDRIIKRKSSITMRGKGDNRNKYTNTALGKHLDGSLECARLKNTIKESSCTSES